MNPALARLLSSASEQAQVTRFVVAAVRSHIDRAQGVGRKWKPRVPLYQRWRERGVMRERPSPFNSLPLLKRTRTLYKSIRARVRKAGSGVEIVVSGADYGIYQDRGFKTSGPNFIPLSNRKTNLVSGRDYFIAKNGVTVPSRPFIELTNNDLKDLSKIVARRAAEQAASVIARELKKKGPVTWHRQFK